MVRILVVDDDQSIREMLQMMFEYAGYDVIEASDGDEALNVMRTCTDQLVVLLDLMMPKLNAIGVLQAVSLDERLATQHGFVLISASRDLYTLDLDVLVPLLSIPVVSKPFAMNHLLDVVDRVVRRISTPFEAVAS